MFNQLQDFLKRLEELVERERETQRQIEALKQLMMALMGHLARVPSPPPQIREK